MTSDKAIKELQDRIKLIKSDYPQNTDYEKVLNIAIEVIKKQIPQKPTNMVTLTDSDGGYYETKGECPNCGRKGFLSSFKYCHKCGQALDWSVKVIEKSYRTELQRLREKVGISQKRLADDLNVSQTAIGFWERGERVPSVDSAYKLAKYFGTSMEQLFSLGESLEGTDK